MRARPRIILFTIVATFVAQATAWTWIWRSRPDEHEMDRGNDTKPCTNIDHKEGLWYEFDSEEDYVCLLTHGVRDCADPPGGYSCHQHSGKASQDFLSYQVVSGDYEDNPGILSSTTASSSTSEPTTAPSTSSSSSTGTTFTTTGTAAPDSAPDSSTTDPPANDGDESGGNSLSGGAIAGIVIGAVAGLAIIGLLAFYLGRRRNQNNRPSPFAHAKPAVKVPSSQSETGGEAGEAEDRPQHETPPSGAVKWGGPSSPTQPAEPEEPGPAPYTTRPPPGTALAELSTSRQIVEMTSSNQINEMSNSSQVNELSSSNQILELDGQTQRKPGEL